MKSELLRRPILVAGLSLTAGVWLLHGLDASILDLGSSAVWGAIVVGSSIWWIKSRFSSNSTAIELPIPSIDRARVNQAFTTLDARIEKLATELAEPDATVVQQFREQAATLKGSLDRESVQLVVLGNQSVGKTSAAQLLQSGDSTARTELTLSQEAAFDAEQIKDTDLVLFVTTGDLTDSEFQTIQQLLKNHHRVLLAFNKQDQYLPADRPVILQQLRDRLQNWIPAEDVVAITAKPAPIKVKQHQAGEIQERVEQPEPEIAGLQSRLSQVLTSRSALVEATVYRQTQALLRSVQTELHQVQRTRALPVIEQYQWIAAATAFANPVPSLDLLATATINAQMVMDLGKQYQQSFSLEQAKTVAGHLASQMVKLGLVEMASQAIAPLLKSHALTYAAGGTLQGISAAYLTRVAGLSLVEYFEEQNQSAEAGTLNLDRLIAKLKQVFQANQRTAFLQTLVKQGMNRLLPPVAQGS